MVNQPPKLVGQPVTINGNPGVIRKWASQCGTFMVEVDWADGTRTWVDYHSTHAEPATPAKPKRRKN